MRAQPGRVSGLVFGAAGAGYFAAMVTAERIAARLGRQIVAAGGALMIALIGVVFFGALGDGAFTHAFTSSLVVLAALTAVTAALVQLLPRAA
jgi:hypothetical protein